MTEGHRTYHENTYVMSDCYVNINIQVFLWCPGKVLKHSCDGELTWMKTESNLLSTHFTLRSIDLGVFPYYCNAMYCLKLTCVLVFGLQTNWSPTLKP